MLDKIQAVISILWVLHHETLTSKGEEVLRDSLLNFHAEIFPRYGFQDRLPCDLAKKLDQEIINKQYKRALVTAKEAERLIIDREYGGEYEYHTLNP